VSEIVRLSISLEDDLLGGFLGRKCDGEPGWLTIWHGLETLLTALRGYRQQKNVGKNEPAGRDLRSRLFDARFRTGPITKLLLAHVRDSR
jgi:hypothetical protein